jgi:predicted nucleic acid-binding protein
MVVADTTPLRHLVEIGYEYLLPRLFTKVWIPGMVASELQQERMPAVVRQWAEHLPSWIEVFTVTGTLGVLVEAARFNLISIEDALERLATTSFRRTPNLFAQTRELVRNLRNRDDA